MTEGLAAQISSIVRQHLADAHRMLGALLTQLDAAGEVDLGGRAAAPETTKPAIAAPSALPSTVERRRRLQRAKQRQAAPEDGDRKSSPLAADPAAAAGPEDPWPQLRAAFQAEIRRRHLTRRAVAGEIHVSKAAVIGWLSPSGRAPSATNIARIRSWLSPPADPAPAPGIQELEAADTDPAEPPPPFVLSVEERAALAGHISLSKTPELRERFGATRELLEQAAAGEHLNADIIARLRATLANGAIAE